MSIDAYIRSLEEVVEKQKELIAAQKKVIAAHKSHIEELEKINDELIEDRVLLSATLSQMMKK